MSLNCEGCFIFLKQRGTTIPRQKDKLTSVLFMGCTSQVEKKVKGLRLAVIVTRKVPEKASEDEGGCFGG